MADLLPPPPALVARIEKEVAFENRLVGGSLHLRAGVRVVSLYRLEEVFMLLAKPHPQIDLGKLQAWISRVIRDEELARAIGQIRAGAGSRLHTIMAVRDVIGMRLIQCRQSVRGPGKSAAYHFPLSAAKAFDWRG